LGLATVIAGAYTGSWNSASLGQSQSGYRLRATQNKEMVRSDSYGDSAIEGVFRGGDVFLLWTGIEYASAIGSWWPYGSAFGAMNTGGGGNPVGLLDVGSSLAQQVSLTAATGTPAIGNPTNLAGSQAIIDENFSRETMLSSNARMLNFSMRLYPYVNSGLRFFTAV